MKRLQFLFFMGYLLAMSGCHSTRLKEQGKITRGILTNSELINDVVRYYSFSVSGITYNGNSKELCDEASVGDSISIIYLPDNPEINAPACYILGNDKVKP
jgi:hypothetical protein